MTNRTVRSVNTEQRASGFIAPNGRGRDVFLDYANRTGGAHSDLDALRLRPLNGIAMATTAALLHPSRHA